MRIERIATVVRIPVVVRAQKGTFSEWDMGYFSFTFNAYITTAAQVNQSRQKTDCIANYLHSFLNCCQARKVYYIVIKHTRGVSCINKKPVLFPKKKFLETLSKLFLSLQALIEIVAQDTNQTLVLVRDATKHE